MKRTRLRPVSSKRRKRDRNYPEARRLTFQRANGRCEVFIDGVRCPLGCEQVHHLAGRGGPDPHRLDNLLGVCRWHHDLIHANPEWARHYGLMVSRHGGGAA